jgi:phage I-like protein
MKVNARIVAYRISNGALSAKDLPRRLKFLEWGENATFKGPVRVSEFTVAELPKNQRAQRWDRIALDYEHNCLPGTPEFERSQEPRAVAAYGVAVCVPGEGLYLDDIQWTPHGEKYAREYVDLSPAPLLTQDGTVTGVHSVALCRHGAVDGLSFYSVEIPNKEERRMDWKKWLLGWLGKSEETTEADLQKGFGDKIAALCAEAVKPIQTALDALKAQVVALNIPADATPKIEALSADIVTLKTATAKYEAEIAKRDREDLLSQAAREGKVVALSTEAIAALTVEQLKDHVQALPVTVPLDQRTVPGVKPLSVDSGASLSQQDIELGAKFGFSAEEMKKANTLR